MNYNTTSLLRSCLMARESKIAPHCLKNIFASPKVLSYSTTTTEAKVALHTSNSTAISGRYMRSLPFPASSLYSAEGKALFDEAWELRTAEGFLEIATNLTTQNELTSCGLSSLAAILNALSIDPERVWKGSWRWYDETMFPTTIEKLEETEADQGLSFQDLINLVPSEKVKLQAIFAADSSLKEFREHLRSSCSLGSSSFILANYSRTTLNQTGKGHFSPIGAYNSCADHVLIMDVARFKYPPHWVPCSNLWEAMSVNNPSTGKTRGYMVISKP